VKVGIIDLGTNTFNLLIAEIDDKGGYNPLYRSKIGVKLGEGSFSKNYITEEAMERAFVALEAQITKIKNQYCDRILAFATAAVRNASNGQQFVDKVSDQFGVNIMVIDGDKEAHMIYQGVQLAGALDENQSLIMDIGGGSTEFIIANDQEIIWKKSYEIGVSRLMEKYNPSDPIEIQEEAAIRNYLAEQLSEAFDEARKETVVQLIGSSGSFDTFSDVLAYRLGNFEEIKDLKSLSFEKEKLEQLLKELIWSKHSERERMEGMAVMRIRMIVLSAILTDLVMSEVEFENVKLSRYALKEGVLFDVLKGNI